MMKNEDSDTSSVISGGDVNYSESMNSSFESDQHEPEFDDKNTFLEQDSGMQEVPKWLKTLRLHKVCLYKNTSFPIILAIMNSHYEKYHYEKSTIVGNVAICQ